MISSKKFWFWIAAGLLTLAACVPPPPQAPQKPKIGFSLDSFVVERWQRDRDIFLSEARRLGAEVIFQNANEDHEVQVRQIQYLIDQHVSVIVVVPNDGVRLAPYLKKAREAGIHVLAYDRLVKNGGADLYVSFDNAKTGRLMAEALVAARPHGQFVIINGAESDQNSYFLNQGFHEVLDPLVLKKRLTITGETWLQSWSNQEAVDAMNGLFVTKTPFNGLIAANDFLADSVIRVLAEKQLLDKVLVVGHDADLSACQRLVEGTQLLTIYKPIDQLARTAAGAALKLARGEAVETTDTVFDGESTIPFIKLDPIAVNKDNLLQTVIKDGYHRIDEVYRHLPKDQWPKP